MKNILLTAFLVISQLLLGLAGIYNWSQISYQAFLTDAGDVDVVTGASPDQDYSISGGIKSGFRWQHELTARLSSKFQLELENNFFLSQKSAEIRNSFQFNYARLKFSYYDGIHRASISYGNRYYNDGETKLLTLPGLERQTKQRLVHNTYLYYKLHLNRVKLELSGGIRNLDYEYYDVSLEENGEELRETDWEVDRYREWDHDLFGSLELQFNPVTRFALVMKGYLKDDLNDNKAFDLSRIGLGLQYEDKSGITSNLKAGFVYYHNDHPGEDDPRDNYFETNIRYVRRIGTGLSGFVSYVNKSCYDYNQQEFLRISNLVRMRLKYSYGKGRIRDSYLLAGLKLNPENEGSSVILENSNYIWKDIYLTGGCEYAPDLFLLVTAQLEYHLRSGLSVWIREEYTDFELFPSQHLVLSGMTVFF